MRFYIKSIDNEWYIIEKSENAVEGLPVIHIVSPAYKTYEEADQELKNILNKIQEDSE